MSCTAGTLVVEEAFDSSAVSIQDCDIPNPEFEPGGSTNVEVLVENNNDVAAQVSIEVLLDGTAAVNGTDTISANSTDWALVTLTTSQEGTFNVEVELAGASEA